MVDFESKKIIINQNYFLGEKSKIIPCSKIDPEMIASFSEDELQSIFNENILNHILRHSNKPWNIFLELYTKTKNEKFGLLWIIVNDDSRRDISIHGGGWNNSIANGKLYLDAWKTVIAFLNKHFSIIRTSCHQNNLKAKKFIEKTGFKSIENNSNHIHFVLAD